MLIDQVPWDELNTVFIKQAFLNGLLIPCIYIEANHAANQIRTYLRLPGLLRAREGDLDFSGLRSLKSNQELWIVSPGALVCTLLKEFFLVEMATARRFFSPFS
jgi:hypothetical protein